MTERWNSSAPFLAVSQSDETLMLESPEELYLREVSHFFSVGGSHAVLEVLHLVVPVLDGGAPAISSGGHVQVLAAATGCS